MRNDAISIGCGHTRFGRLDALSPEDLIVAAAREAIVDSGVSPENVDAVWLRHFNFGMVPDAFAFSMILAADSGLRFKPATRCKNACASGSTAIYSAMDAIKAGRCRIMLVVVTARDGRLPVNISGGLKAKGHPVGATGASMRVLAAWQPTRGKPAPCSLQARNWACATTWEAAPSPVMSPCWNAFAKHSARSLIQGEIEWRSDLNGSMTGL